MPVVQGSSTGIRVFWFDACRTSLSLGEKNYLKLSPHPNLPRSFPGFISVTIDLVKALKADVTCTWNNKDVGNKLDQMVEAVSQDETSA